VSEVHGGPASAAASVPPLELDDDDPLLEPDEDEELPLASDEPLLDEEPLEPPPGESVGASSPPPELELEVPDDDAPDEPLVLELPLEVPLELPLEEADTVPSPPPSSLEEAPGEPLLPPHPTARLMDTPAHTLRQARSFLMAKTSAGSVYLGSGSGPKKSGAHVSSRSSLTPRASPTTRSRPTRS
jgi:hypothetical protein